MCYTLLILYAPKIYFWALHEKFKLSNIHLSVHYDARHHRPVIRTSSGS